ncbi:MAG: family oligoendopeptidase [Clostridiales bacterium]|jgi:pepF/M3 family oligoendopeptidase|nr:family oligoendopeptidase [Clostridiales bacterium]
MHPIIKLNSNWDLSQLYYSFEDPTFIHELSQAEDDFYKIKTLLSEDREISSEYLLNCLEYMDTANLLLTKVSSFVNLTLMVNSSHSEALHFNNRISSLQAASQQSLMLLQHKVGSLDNIEKLISDCNELIPYSFLLRESYKTSKQNASVVIEDIILQMQLTGSRAWQRLRDSLDGAAMVSISLKGEEKSLPLSAVRALASDTCQETRHIAYQTELTAYKSYEGPMAACLSAIKGEALTTMQWRGYETVLDRMLDVNKMDEQTLSVMMESIEAHLPAFRNYLKAKSHVLGHKNGLPWYDLLAPVGQNSRRFTYDEAYKYLVDIFTGFDKNMGSFIKNAFENRWIDAFPKEGKVGGALCADLPSLRQNRIFANFSGSYSDVRTLAHELGHAFHSRCLDKVPLVMRDPPTPICETASLFNETIVQEQLLQAVSAEEQLFLLEAGLRESTQTVVDIYSRFLFEKEVFERRKSHNLSEEELCEIMLSAQHTAYGDGLDPEYLHPYMWMCKVHYYIPEYHYYNFPYTFGLLFAKGLYARYKRKPEGFMEEYINLLKSTCSNDMAGIAVQVDIDIHSRAFWDSSLEMIVEDINHFIKLCENI